MCYEKLKLCKEINDGVCCPFIYSEVINGGYGIFSCEDKLCYNVYTVFKEDIQKKPIKKSLLDKILNPVEKTELGMHIKELQELVESDIKHALEVYLAAAAGGVRKCKKCVYNNKMEEKLCHVLFGDESVRGIGLDICFSGQLQYSHARDFHEEYHEKEIGAYMDIEDILDSPVSPYIIVEDRHQQELKREYKKIIYMLIQEMKTEKE